jgi:hypothetical protein
MPEGAAQEGSKTKKTSAESHRRLAGSRLENSPIARANVSERKQKKEEATDASSFDLSEKWRAA